ncbi:MAG: START domain-containing protein [Aquabacterium sp.]|nr:START domain-containing protein [Aquabacterium sp.]
MHNTNRFLGFALVALFALQTHGAWAASDQDWQADANADGIQLYTRQMDGHPLRDFKGVMQVQAPLAQVAAMLADVPAMPEWFFMLREARFIQGEHVDDSHIYLAMKGLWPVSPRDAVAHVSVKQDPSTLTIHVLVDSAEGIMPKQEGYVRIPRMHSSWRLTPIGATRTEVEIVGYADPGGWIPLSIANFLVTTLPRESLKKMREFIAKPEYRDVARIYAKNPKLKELAERLRFPKP